MKTLLMQSILIIAGVAHFLIPEKFAISIEFLPYAHEIVLLTGALEILFALGLQIKGYRELVARVLIVYFIAIIPAHIYVAVNGVEMFGVSNKLVLWIRTVLQSVFIYWAYSISKDSKIFRDLLEYVTSDKELIYIYENDFSQYLDNPRNLKVALKFNQSQYGFIYLENKELLSLEGGKFVDVIESSKEETLINFLDLISSKSIEESKKLINDLHNPTVQETNENENKALHWINLTQDFLFNSYKEVVASEENLMSTVVHYQSGEFKIRTFNLDFTYKIDFQGNVQVQVFDYKGGDSPELKINQSFSTLKFQAFDTCIKLISQINQTIKDKI